MSRLLFTQKGNRILAVAAWVAIALLTAAAGLFGFRLSGGLWQCPFRRYVGLDCIGCGASRAMDALFRLDFLEAFRYNPFFLLALAAFLVWLVLFTQNAFSKKYRPPFSRQPALRLLIVIGVLLLVFLVVRNLPFYQQWFYA